MRKTLDAMLVGLLLAVIAALGARGIARAQEIEDDLHVGFKTQYQGVDDAGLVLGSVKNSSRREYACVRIEFALSTRFDRRQQGEAPRDLGGHVTVVRSVEALSTKTFEDDLPFPAAVRLDSVSECGQEAPMHGDTEAAGSSGTGVSVTPRDDGRSDGVSMTAPAREKESKPENENEVIKAMEEERRKLEEELEELPHGGGSFPGRSSVVDHRQSAPTQGPAQRPGRPSESATADDSREDPAEVGPSDQFLGEIRLFGGNYAPRGWALCDGRLLSINEHQALYSVLGTRYGGDGRTEFGLPDLRGQLGVSFIISLEGRYPPRQ